MDSLDLHATVQRLSPDLAADVEGGLVMMDAKKGFYYGLKESGVDIWRRLEQPKGVEALAEELIRDYQGDPETIRRDLLTLLRDLAKHGLLRLL